MRHVTAQRVACHLGTPYWTSLWTSGLGESGSRGSGTLGSVERGTGLDSTGLDLDLAAPGPAAYLLENRTLELELGGDVPHHHHRCSRSGTAVQTVGMGMQRNAAGGPHGRMGVVLLNLQVWMVLVAGG